MSADKPFMTLEEIAELLGVNYQLIYKLVREGALPAVRLGRVYRVKREDLDAYLEQTKTGGPQRCSACGASYHSRASVPHGCTECGSAICVDCWLRRKVRLCAEHKETKKS